MGQRDIIKNKKNRDAIKQLGIDNHVEVIKTGEKGMIIGFNKYKNQNYMSVTVKFDNYENLASHMKTRTFSGMSLKKR